MIEQKIDNIQWFLLVNLWDQVIYVGKFNPASALMNVMTTLWCHTLTRASGAHLHDTLMDLRNGHIHTLCDGALNALLRNRLRNCRELLHDHFAPLLKDSF